MTIALLRLDDPDLDQDEDDAEMGELFAACASELIRTQGPQKARDLLEAAIALEMDNAN